jgi:hypothetical protein
VSDLAALGLLALVVVIAAAAGLVVGRMVASRIDRWQERAGPPDGQPATQAVTQPAIEEPGDDADPS